MRRLNRNREFGMVAMEEIEGDDWKGTSCSNWNELFAVLLWENIHDAGIKEWYLSGEIGEYIIEN